MAHSNDDTAGSYVSSLSPSSFLCLPFELRCMIYEESLPKPQRLPTAKEFQAIYMDDLRMSWVRPPSPLLLLNKQIHEEVSRMLAKSEICLNVTGQPTGQGIILDEASVSATIAQKACSNLENNPHLRIDVWPPRQDRPVEFLYILESLERIRDKISNCSQLQRLTVTFKDKGLCKWLKSDKFTPSFPWYESPNSSHNVAAFASFLDVFATLSNVKHVEFEFAESMGNNQRPRFRKLQERAMRVAEVMCGSPEPFTPFHNHEILLNRSLLKSQLKRKTAQLAYCRLKRLTDDGNRRLSRPMYSSVVKPWPYFETLPEYQTLDFEGIYCDKKPPSIMAPLYSSPVKEDKKLASALAQDAKQMIWRITAHAKENTQPDSDPEPVYTG
ncbi:MAG: hypothetical protein Q9168_007924 [Polycauliona sp. 1 TL-2023]